MSKSISISITISISISISMTRRYELGNKLTRHPVTVARIDATLYRSAAEIYNVRGFPTIRLIGKDRTLEYVGDRTSVSIVYRDFLDNICTGIF